MVRDKTTTLTWRPTTPDGAIGDPVDVVMPERDADAMRSWWAKVRAIPTGAARTRGLIEIRFVMDLYEAFPGMTFQGEEAR